MKISHISNIIHITLMFLPLSKKFLYVLLNSFLLLSPISCKAVSVNPTELLRCASNIPRDVFMISHTFGLSPPLTCVLLLSSQVASLHLSSALPFSSQGHLFPTADPERNWQLLWWCEEAPTSNCCQSFSFSCSAVSSSLGPVSSWLKQPWLTKLLDSSLKMFHLNSPSSSVSNI